MKITVKIGEVEISAEYDHDAIPYFDQVIPDGEELHSEEKDLLMDRVAVIAEKAIEVHSKTTNPFSAQEEK